MAGHGRPKDGVASLAYAPAIHALLVVGRRRGCGFVAVFLADEFDLCDIVDATAKRHISPSLEFSHRRMN
jgi:hypothetical protein